MVHPLNNATRPAPSVNSILTTTLKAVFPILLLLAGWSRVVTAQASGEGLRLDPDYSAERLVKEVFANDRCQTIYNVRQIGSNPAGIGYFEGPDKIVGFNRGIVISTGRMIDAEGPNQRTDTGTEMNGVTPDPDLDLASNGIIHDRTGLEFDFIPLESTVTFRYVFASEEYCEFVGAKFNDIFGFFISGPGFDGPFDRGAVNVARIPGTNNPVSINTVNYRVNKDFYLDNESAGVREESGCEGGAENGPRFGDIEYDGQTVILTATIKVQPCATYHIRLLVADVKDANFDSAVFLEAGSFDLGASASLQATDGSKTIDIYEDCSPNFMRVRRGPESDTARAQTVSYRLGSRSVATDTLDFRAGGNSVTIPRGQDFIDVPLQALADTLIEGAEEAWLVLDVPCACFTDSVRIVVREAEPLSIGEQDDFYYCPGTNSTLVANHQGGVPPFSYAWNFGSTEAEPIITDNLPDTVAVTITDACGSKVSWRAAAIPSAPPTILFPDRSLAACWGETKNIPLELTGVGPFTVSYRFNGGSERQLILPVAGTADWPVTAGGTYQVTAVEDLACASRVNQLLEVKFYRPVVRLNFTDPECSGDTNGTITATHLPTLPPYRYSLNETPIESLMIGNLSSGTYTLTVTDSLGCNDQSSVALLEPEPLEPITINCDQLRNPPLRLSAGGGVPPYSYSIDGSAYGSGDVFDSLRSGSVYRIGIRDASGCEIEQPVFFLPGAASRAVALPNFVRQKVGESAPIYLEYRVPLNQLRSFQWSPEEFFDCPTCPRPNVSVPYTRAVSLVVTDIYGCTDSLTTRVAVDGSQPVYVPNAFSPNGDGTNDYLTLFANPEVVETVLYFRIFTRWGNQVWEGVDFLPNLSLRGWDGRYGGRTANTGVYPWTAEVRLRNGGLQQLAGTVTLLAR